ncbi:MAG TPA: hypothetical protein VFM32_03805 [Spongiibacteraceae bacterium]|nr:hypothetical protein [Spongiibacteraceae bacterium]
MPRYKMVVLSRPVEGREAEFNEWYQHVHLGEVVAFRGFKSAQRFRRVKSLTGKGDYPYLVIYEIETDDIDAVLGELESKAGQGALTMSAAFTTEFVQAGIYEELGPAVSEQAD